MSEVSAEGMPRSGHPSADAIAMMRYDAAKRSCLIAYLIWFFGGWLGLHRFYLRRSASAVAMLVLPVVSGLLIPVGIGLLGLAVLGLWWLIDALLIPGMTASCNSRIIAKLAR